MSEQDNSKTYLIYGVSCVCVVYYKRKVKRLKLELYRETKSKENQSSVNNSVLTAHYNLANQNGIKKATYLDNYEDDNGSYSNYINDKNAIRKDKLSYISEGTGEVQEKSRDKYQSLYSINTTIQSVNSIKPTYSYYSLNNSSDNYQHQSTYSLNHLQDPTAYPDTIQKPPSIYLNNHNNILFYDEVQNSQADSVSTISTTTTITTNTNLNNINAMAYSPTATSRTNIRNYLSRPQVIPKIHENLRINTSGLKPGSSPSIGYKVSPNNISPNSTHSSTSTIPKHKLFNYPSNGSFIQNQSQEDHASFFTTKPLSTSMITTTTMAMAQKSSYGHYELSNTIIDTQTDVIPDNKRISLIQNQEKYSQSPSSLRNLINVDDEEDNDGDSVLKKKRNEKRRSYTEQLKPILSKISLAELKEANASRPQSAKLPSDKVKVIKVKKHLSYTEQLTPVLSEKGSSIISDHIIPSLDRSKFRHSIQSIQSIHSVQSAHSIHNVIDEELVSPRPISLISNQRLSFMTSEIEDQLNREDLRSVKSSESGNEKDEDEVVVIDENKEINETLQNTPSPATAARLSWEKSDKETSEEITEKNKKESSALARVSLLIDKLENTAVFNSPISLSSDSTNNTKRNSTKHFIHSPLSDSGDSRFENIKRSSLTISIDDNRKADNKRNSERSSRYYSKQRLSLISNYSDVSEHNNSTTGGSILKLYKKPSVSTVSSSTASVNSHSPYSKRTSISPLPGKNHSPYVRSPLDKEIPSTITLNNDEDEKKEKEENVISKEKNISSFISVVEEGDESEDEKKDVLEETSSSKNTLSVSSSSFSRSIYMDVRKEGSTIPSIIESEQDTDNSSAHKRAKTFTGLYNFFEVRPAKSKQRKAQSSGGTSQSSGRKDNMKFEEVSESDINPLTKNFVLYDSDSIITDSHESKKQSFNSSSSNLNNFNYDFNTSFSSSQKNLKFNEGGKEKEKIYDLLKENNSSSINSNVSGPMVKNAIYSYYSNQSNGGNSQYQNDNINLKFLNTSFNGSVNFNNESFEINEEEDDMISNGYGMEMGEKVERNHNLLIDRRSLYSMNQPVKPPKSQRRQQYPVNQSNRLTSTPTRDDDIHSNSSPSLNFAELQRYQNASMPLALDKYKNYYYQGSFATTKSNTSSVTSQTVQNIYGYNNQLSNHDEDDTIKDTNENHEMNTSFGSRTHSLLAHSTSEHSTHSSYSYQSNKSVTPYKRLTISSPVSTASSSTNIVSNANINANNRVSKLNLNDITNNDSETNKGNLRKKHTSEPWSAASFKSSTSVVSYTSSNYSSDMKEGHTVNDTDKLPQRIKDSIPKRSQYSSQKEHRRSSSTHRKRKHSGSAHPPSIVTNSKSKEKGAASDEIENEASFSFTLYSPSQNVNKTSESKSQPSMMAPTSSQHFTQNTDASESNIVSPILPKKPGDDDDHSNGFDNNNNNMNITVNHLSLDININKDHKNCFGQSPESLDSAKTLNNLQLFKNKDKEQENSSLKTTSPFSIVNNHSVIEEKGDSKVASLKSPFSSSYNSNSGEAPVPLLRDIISDSILQMQSRKLQPIRGKVHILHDSASPRTSPNVSPVLTPKFIETNVDDYSKPESESINIITSVESSFEKENKENDKTDVMGKGKEKEENEEEEEEEKYSQPIPTFIYNDEIESDEKIISSKPVVSLSQESESNTTNISIQKLPNRMPEKRKYDVIHHNTSPLIKSHGLKKKLLSSGVTSQIYVKNNGRLSPNIARKTSPLSFYNNSIIRSNYSTLSRIEEDGSLEQSFTAPTPTYHHRHINLENNDGNNEFSVGTDTSRTSDSTTVTEYKNMPNATDQSASIIYNKSSISISSDEYSDDEEIISVDINLISQDDASTYNSPFLFPVITPPNYDQLIKDQSYKL
ncbi:hypothetical protein PIROE2DRAFT_57670 [Piromyces sp. E2]|nr:hypothetical protein PIROE2DRAFT_57670 [Piromyces sp. E2]|eukprot:OUM69031.1 hypothetical protein PIROE2DRAFT_57670 [Piromyces sp. E2]